MNADNITHTVQKRHLNKKIKTSWEGHGKWYAEVVGAEGSYQKEVILPGVLKLLNIKKGEAILDVACGEGFFSREFKKAEANILGIDASRELIELAKKKSPKEILFRVADAKNLSFLNNAAFDAVVIILALQNIDNILPVLKEARHVLKTNGHLVAVINHPVFRIPKFSGWGWDNDQHLQYRKINRYMSEVKLPIEMHPGGAPKEITWSFHRPLEYYFKAFKAAGFAVKELEEWVSHKKSQAGPKAKAEDRARSEFPLFMAFKAEVA